MQSSTSAARSSPLPFPTPHSPHTPHTPRTPSVHPAGQARTSGQPLPTARVHAPTVLTRPLPVAVARPIPTLTTPSFARNESPSFAVAPSSGSTSSSRNLSPSIAFPQSVPRPSILSISRAPRLTLQTASSPTNGASGGGDASSLSSKAAALVHSKSLRQQRPLDLQSLLQTSVGFRFLFVHVYREYSEENLLSYSSIESYQRYPTLKSLQSFTRKYIADGAELMINISSATRRRILELVAAASAVPPPPAEEINLATALDEAQAEIVQLLERDSFQRFKQSLLYVAYIAGAQPPNILKRAGADDEQADLKLILSCNSKVGKAAIQHLQSIKQNKKK